MWNDNSLVVRSIQTETGIVHAAHARLPATSPRAYVHACTLAAELAAPPSQTREDGLISEMDTMEVAGVSTPRRLALLSSGPTIGSE